MKSMSQRRTRHVLSVGRLHVSPVLLGMLTLTLAAFSQTAGPTGGRTLFTSDALNLRFAYPSTLEPHDLSEAMADGRLTMLGLSAGRSETKGSLPACLRPLLLARTPQRGTTATTTERPAVDGSETVVTVTPVGAATLMLAELDPNCLLEAEQVSGRKDLPVMAQQFLATPGMAAVAQPASYTIGSQKVFMAAAQGHPETPPATGSDASVQPASTPFTIFTMAIATTWNNHLLVWLMSSNQIGLLDQMSKSTVRFGRGAEAPLYPRPMGNADAVPAPQ